MRKLALSALFMLATASASTAVIILDFEGLGNSESVGDYYNGGFGGNGSGPGPNYGITFGSASLALIDSDAGGSGNFGGEPSPDTILFFLQGSAVLNIPAGFSSGFSFYYSAVSSAGFVNVYDGENATGNLLLSINLPVTPSDGGDPNGLFSPFYPVGGVFDGIAKSIDFGGTANYIGFDNITFGSDVPIIPEPAAVLGLGGLLVSSTFLTRSRRKDNR